MVKIGDPLPIAIEEAKGKACIIYFYPKDDTPGCTKEACGFRDEMHRLLDKGVTIIGVSPDNKESHEKFKTKYNLNFILISDEDRAIAKAFEVLKEKNIFGMKKLGVERSTFLIDKNGIIVWMERNVSVLGHVERVCSAVEMLL